MDDDSNCLQAYVQVVRELSALGDNASSANVGDMVFGLKCWRPSMQQDCQSTLQAMVEKLEQLAESMKSFLVDIHKLLLKDMDDDKVAAFLELPGRQEIKEGIKFESRR